MSYNLLFIYLQVAAFSSILLRVTGHGFVHNVMVDNQSYAGWNPFVDPYANPIPQRIVRKIPSDGPITNISDPNLACNTGGELGTGLVANASAGSVVSFEWDYWPSDHLGPVSTYMTSCNDNCGNFDVSGAQWFKLDAEGYDNGQWASAELIADGFTWNSTIPAALAPGQYLMRHEIVALHSNPAQFYPSCSQVQVSGTGTGQPSDSSLVLIPGLYDNVQWPDIYTDFGSFTVPGPAPVELTGGGGSAFPTSTASFTPTSNPSTPVSVAPTILASNRCLLSPRKLLKRHTSKSLH